MLCNNCREDRHGQCSTGPHDPPCGCIQCWVNATVKVERFIHVRFSPHKPVELAQGELSLFKESPRQLWFEFAIERIPSRSTQRPTKLHRAKWWFGQMQKPSV